MRVFFVCCFVLCAAAVMTGAATDGYGIVPVAVRLTGEATVRPQTIVFGSRAVETTATPDPTLEPTHAPVVHAAVVATTEPTPIPTPKPTPTPTPKPTPKPTLKPTTPPPSQGREEVKAEIRQAWGGDDNKAISVADCESGLNTRASSPTGKDLGLWQFTMKTWHDYGGSGDPRDSSAATQTSVAWRLYQQQGWNPWPGCS